MTFVTVGISCTLSGYGESLYDLLVQDGRLNCLLCAARYGRTELFHHLVQKYGCDPKETDQNTTVSLLAQPVHTSLCLTHVVMCHSPA